MKTKMKLQTKEMIYLTTTVAMVAIAMLLAFFRTGQLIDTRKQEVLNQAIDGCMKISSYTYVASKSGVTTVEPIEKSYEKCLELKNLK